MTDNLKARAAIPASLDAKKNPFKILDVSNLCCASHSLPVHSQGQRRPAAAPPAGGPMTKTAPGPDRGRRGRCGGNHGRHLESGPGSPAPRLQSAANLTDPKVDHFLLAPSRPRGPAQKMAMSSSKSHRFGNELATCDLLDRTIPGVQHKLNLV